MAAFDYKAIDKQGREQRGAEEAGSGHGEGAERTVATGRGKAADKEECR